MARRFTRRKRRATKWCSATLNGLIPDAASLIVGDGLALCPTTTAVEDQADPMMGWMRGQFSISRVQPAAQQVAIAWAVVLQRTTVGTESPVQIFNPFDGDDLARQDVLGMGCIPAPAIILVPSTDAPTADQSTSCIDIDIGVGRKVDRNNNMLFLWLASTDSVPPGVDNAFHVIGSMRTLMKFP